MESVKIDRLRTMFLALVILVVIPAVAQERSTEEPETDKIVYVEATLSVSPSRAFAYFTDNSLLQSWLAPIADVQRITGGKYELFWSPNDRKNFSTIGCRVTAISDGQLIAFQWRSPKQFKAFANAADPLTHVVVAFLADQGGTKVILVHSGWRSSTKWEEARAWQERAWRGAFDKLQEVAKSQAPGAQSGVASASRGIVAAVHASRPRLRDGRVCRAPG